VKLVETVFSSVKSLAKSFSINNVEEDTDINDAKSCNQLEENSIDIHKIACIYDMLINTNVDEIADAIVSSLNKLTAELKKQSCSMDEALVSYIVILEHPGVFDPQYSTVLQNLFTLIDNSSPIYKSEFRSLLLILGEKIYRKYVAIIRHHTTLLIYDGAGKYSFNYIYYLKNFFFLLILLFLLFLFQS